MNLKILFYFNNKTTKLNMIRKKCWLGNQNCNIRSESGANISDETGNLFFNIVGYFEISNYFCVPIAAHHRSTTIHVNYIDYIHDFWDCWLARYLRRAAAAQKKSAQIFFKNKTATRTREFRHCLVIIAWNWGNWNYNDLNS